MTDTDISAEAVDFLKEKRDAEDASFGGCKLSAPLHEYPCERDCPCALRDQVIALRTALDAAEAREQAAFEAALREAANEVAECQWGDYWRSDGEYVEPKTLASNLLRHINSESGSALDRMLDEARRIEVKPLEWQEAIFSASYFSVTITGEYRVTKKRNTRNDKWMVTFLDPARKFHTLGYIDGLNAAKASAQADYDARIAAAIRARGEGA